ncbi:MAG: glycosyltransferase 87 family protein [Oligoflexia bacterium]|nr:glycosyltransferase 87 family protein [Oligoflexia bacterium]
MKSFRSEWLLRNWGFAALTLLSILAGIRLLLQRVPGHYRVFTGAGRALWEGGEAYGTTFGTGVGYFFYSPSCGMFLFGPFSLLPEKIGLGLYMTLSWAVFIIGAISFARSYRARNTGRDAPLLRPFPSANWFWLAIAGQMVGGILASKLEILMTGILLLSLSWLMRGAREILAAALLALILVWKFQPLPTVGLALVAWVLVWRDWRLPTWVLGFTALWWFLPFAFKPPGYLVASLQVWSETFSIFIQKAWIDFENLFAFLEKTFSLGLPFAVWQAISIAVGALLLVVVSIFLLGDRCRAINADYRTREGLLLSAGLGAAFTTVFSPLGQNNALILYAPLLLAGFLSYENARGRWRLAWRWILGLSWVVMTLPYSDLVPRDLRELLRHYSIKPVACLLLGAALALFAFRKSRIPLSEERAPGG